MVQMIFQALDDLQAMLADCHHWYIAYSGGMDSHVLLYYASLWQKSHPEIILHAIHINHGIDKQSHTWQQHTQKVCQQLEIPFTSYHIALANPEGQNLEARARQARYAKLAEVIHPKSCLLTAHHQRDQAETLLLNLLRGSGVAGLAAMPKVKPFAHGYHVRPLLDCSYQSILQLAKQAKLHWITDPMNDNPHYDRNYLRQEVLPIIAKRWPQYAKQFSQSATLCGRQADQLYSQFQKLAIKTILPIYILLAHEQSVQYQYLYYWLKQQTGYIANQKILNYIIDHIIPAKSDAKPQLDWKEYVITRFRQALYVVKKADFVANHNREQIYPWDMHGPLIIAKNQTLALKAIQAPGLNIHKFASKSCSIRFASDGIRFHPYPRAGSHPLKKLWQEWQVPFWLRDKIPLLYADEELVAIVGYAIGHQYVDQTSKLQVVALSS